MYKRWSLQAHTIQSMNSHIKIVLWYSLSWPLQKRGKKRDIEVVYVRGVFTFQHSPTCPAALYFTRFVPILLSIVYVDLEIRLHTILCPLATVRFNYLAYSRFLPFRTPSRYLEHTVSGDLYDPIGVAFWPRFMLKLFEGVINPFLTLVEIISRNLRMRMKGKKHLP